MNCRFQDRTKRLFKPALLLLGFALVGCQEPLFKATPGDYSGARAVERLYVYSFLDIQQDKLGKDYFTIFGSELSKALAAHGVDSRILWFGDSVYRVVEGESTERRLGNVELTSTHRTVPIKETIEANLKEEEALQATHRLIVFPRSTMKHANGMLEMEIEWRIFDTTTMECGWTASTNQTLPIKHDQEAISQQMRPYVQQVIAQMRLSKVLRTT